MQIFLAVVDDLFQFARTSVFGMLSVKLDEGYFKLRTYGEERMPLALYTPTFPTVHQHQEVHTEISTLFLQGGQYFIGVLDTFLYTDPVVSFDTAVRPLAYGELVHVLKLGGRWAHVKARDTEGWIFKDALREKAKDVFPTFTNGSNYNHDNEETKKLRLCIHDMFGAEAAGLPLCDVEYVTYKVWKRGREIAWPVDRPRIAGTWQKKLRGVQGVFMSINPKTESIMEYVTDDIGHLCFVEAVFPDESMKISCIAMNEEGVFDEIMLQKEEWRELRAVFIEVV